jgi:uncharacterized protein involved in exopolysaccharide biosynthesis
MTIAQEQRQAVQPPGEFEELLLSLRRGGRTLWRRRRLALVSAWSVALVAAVALPYVPQRYEASARLVVDTQSALRPLISGMSVQSAEAERQARVLAREAMASSQLARLVERNALGLPAATAEEREDSLVRLIARTKLTADENGIHTVSYRDTDPERAASSRGWWSSLARCPKARSAATCRMPIASCWLSARPARLGWWRPSGA